MPAKKRKSKTKPSARGKLGVWIIGMGGGLATTVIAGTQLVAKGLVPATGIMTETEALSGFGFAALDDLVFGGHDVRPVDLYESAYEIYRETSTIPLEPLQEIRSELEVFQANLRLGTVVNCGDAISKIASRKAKTHSKQLTLAEQLKAIKADLKDFQSREGLRDVIVVNVASTEPPLELDKRHATPAGLKRLIAADDRKALRASSLYAWAAIESGYAYLNFAPSNAGLTPAHLKLALKKGVPVMGNDGKTGETLVKSALAPMFKHRNLKVETWQGYNILGDRDGEVLADDANKKAKISTKDGLLEQILGYPLHTHVAIDYVPSLNDLKTAWDFIHFSGFLNYKMSLQFTWQGCDAILAAPLVLDMVRLADFAKGRGEAGLMPQLACYFKNPLGVDEHDLHRQYDKLAEYLDQRR
ncbi:MAG: inositol-3-phosphate synthase [Planctomycetota bacterium]